MGQLLRGGSTTIAHAMALRGLLPYRDSSCFIGIVLWNLLNFHRRRLLIWSGGATLTLGVTLAADFRSASAGRLTWLLASGIGLLIALAIGIGLGVFNRQASLKDLTALAVVPSCVLFLVVLAQYALALATSSSTECGTASAAYSCFARKNRAFRYALFGVRLSEAVPSAVRERLALFIAPFPGTAPFPG